MSTNTALSNLAIPIDRDIFLRTLIRELAGVLEDVIGSVEASGYISLVGQNVGEWMNELYKKELGVSRLNRRQVAEVLVDLKARIKGDFAVVTEDDDCIVLENGNCPFEVMVLDRPCMCMMTSNVFGVIAAENLGYAKVSIEKSIAANDGLCRVAVYLRASPAADAATGREYFRTSNHAD